jgi:hypothetical protein
VAFVVVLCCARFAAGQSAASGDPALKTAIVTRDTAVAGLDIATFAAFSPPNAIFVMSTGVVNNTQQRVADLETRQRGGPRPAISDVKCSATQLSGPTGLLDERCKAVRSFSGSWRSGQSRTIAGKSWERSSLGSTNPDGELTVVRMAKPPTRLMTSSLIFAASMATRSLRNRTRVMSKVGHNQLFLIRSWSSEHIAGLRTKLTLPARGILALSAGVGRRPSSRRFRDDRRPPRPASLVSPCQYPT